MTTLFATKRTTQSSTGTDNDNNEDNDDSSTNNTGSSSPEHEHVDAVICGGGPAGLLTAIMLAQTLPPTPSSTTSSTTTTTTTTTTKTIRVYDRLSPPPNPDDDNIWNDDIAKFYLLGLGGRGQGALREYGVWDDVVQPRCVATVGRKDWQPGSDQGVERIFDATEKRNVTQVLPRDKLVGCLYQHILEQYSDRIELKYGYEVHPIDLNHHHPLKNNNNNNGGVLLEVAQCQDDEIARMNPSSVKTASSETPVDVLCRTDTTQIISTGFLIAADGTVRTIANAMEQADRKRYDKIKNPVARFLFAKRPFRVKRYVDDNQRIYKTIPMNLPPNWRPDLNYSARSKQATFDALPANRNGNYCGVLLLKKDHPLAAANTDPAALRKLLDDSFPYFSKLLSDETVAQVAAKPVSYLPSFRYAGPVLHYGDRCVILGDCAHTVKPYFGLGANSALEDVRILGRLLNKYDNDIPKAIQAFSQQRAADSRAMVQLSRELDRPGAIGFVTFILPLILDSIFSRLLPGIFETNIINMMQREMLSFRKVARRKRMDRALQVLVLASGFTAIGWSAKVLVRVLARLVGVSPWVMATGLVGTGLVGVNVKKLLLPAKSNESTGTSGNKENKACSISQVRTAAEVLAKFDKKSGIKDKNTR